MQANDEDYEDNDEDYEDGDDGLPPEWRVPGYVPV